VLPTGAPTLNTSNFNNLIIQGVLMKVGEVMKKDNILLVIIILLIVVILRLI